LVSWYLDVKSTHISTHIWWGADQLCRRTIQAAIEAVIYDKTPSCEENTTPFKSMMLDTSDLLNKHGTHTLEGGAVSFDGGVG
jgi:hypothetical protein